MVNAVPLPKAIQWGKHQQLSHLSLTAALGGVLQAGAINEETGSLRAMDIYPLGKTPGEQDQRRLS